MWNLGRRRQRTTRSPRKDSTWAIHALRRARSVVLSSASTLPENAGSGPSVNTVKTGMLGIGRGMSMVLRLKRPRAPDPLRRELATITRRGVGERQRHLESRVWINPRPRKTEHTQTQLFIRREFAYIFCSRIAGV